MTWRHYFRCLGQTSNPKVVGHRGESYTGEILTPTPEVPRFAPICSRCVESMEYVGSGESEARTAPHSSALEPHEHELLAHLADEVCEVGREIAKIFRYGLDGSHPEEPSIANRDRLARECGQAAAAVDMLIQIGALDPAKITRARDEKFRLAGQWFRHVTISGGTVAVIRRGR